jgi:hypothetical protein
MTTSDRALALRRLAVSNVPIITVCKYPPMDFRLRLPVIHTANSIVCEKNQLFSSLNQCSYSSTTFLLRSLESKSSLKRSHLPHLKRILRQREVLDTPRLDCIPLGVPLVIFDRIAAHDQTIKHNSRFYRRVGKD